MVVFSKQAMKCCSAVNVVIHLSGLRSFEKEYMRAATTEATRHIIQTTNPRPVTDILPAFGVLSNVRSDVPTPLNPMAEGRLSEMEALLRESCSLRVLAERLILRPCSCLTGSK